MPFLTSRIADSFNDNKMSHSARSESSISCDSSNLSSFSYDSSITSIRHVNLDAFFENAAHDGFIENNEKLVNMSDTHSDIVPPLDIKSEENYPTTRNYTFSYRKHCEAAKLGLKSDTAFETWLSAKRKLLSDEVVRRKKEEELKKKEIEERKRVAKENYDNWLQKKSQSSTTVQSVSNQTSKPDISYENRKRSNLSTEEVQARLAEWEKAKRLEQERRRMLKQQEEQRRRNLEEQRRQMAADAWENWVSNSSKKPKPVPLNRGIFTLRGTVSDIFVNPNEWKAILPLKNEENK